MNGESKLGNIASAFTLRGMLKTEQYCPALTLSVHTAKYEHCLVTESYEAFFLMVKLELAKMGYQLKVKSVNCDLELSICKAVDSVLNIVVNGCFFHYTQALKRFTEKHGTKRVKDSDLKFNNFVRESVG